MIVTCLGHAKFLLELDNGLRIVTDPYDDQSGYPVTPVNADVVLVSHGHHDHNAVETIGGNPRILREAGVTTLAPDVRVTALSAYHDNVHGAKRGSTLLFLLEAGRAAGGASWRPGAYAHRCPAQDPDPSGSADDPRGRILHH